MKILVTGGSGLVGSALKNMHPEWIYVNSITYGSLTDISNVVKMFDDVGDVDGVVHLAANVGGILKNMNKPVEMFEDNIFMNLNILREARRRKIPHVINLLSTCIFPNDIVYPISPNDLHNGPPHPSNDGYSHAKRAAEVYSRIISANTSTRVTNIIPTNIYGPYDNFSLDDGHVIPALIHRAYLSKQMGKPLKVKGSGTPMRQFIYSDDVARTIAWAVESKDPPPSSFICCTDEEYSISYVANIIANKMGISVEFVDGPDGQMRKTATPGPGAFPRPCVTIEEGIERTINWFTSSGNKRV
jgi:GDP-L-fucose synthase